ncbi:MAG: DUF4301 family protein [Bacteroidales bacterium]|jgi:hypothetical protein|nr:DUF4301 family protein [Bacteroidales bacterium]
MFSQSDLDQITAHGISPQSAHRQRRFVCEEKSTLEIVKPALKNDGLFVFDQAEVERLLDDFQENILGQKIVKFVPASGAATRMFKDLFETWNKLNEDPNSPISDSVQMFFEHLRAFAFYDALQQSMKNQGVSLEKAMEEHHYAIILEYLLTEKGLNYAGLPKGLLLFHQYGEVKRTALEEHLIEAATYACDEDKTARLHFTVSEEHRDLFKNHCENLVPNCEKQFGIRYNITFSTQHSSTDTIAFANDNTPFRDKNGNLLFRPGGHGSLIDNLNKVDADIVLIKNIDNVSLDMYKEDTFVYKKTLIALLRQLQKQIFNYLNMFDEKKNNENTLVAVEHFLQKNFFVGLPKSYQEFSAEKKQDFLYRILDRPVRICGMVKRENEPGGGPFWVKDRDNNLSLQIVETSEINLSDRRQKEILDKSQFFNPVILVCSLKNHRGEKFNLNACIDHSRYFVSEKSHEGKILKAIENPGLWNGAMSDWLTVFCAIPLSTFTPVKTVNDLLRKEHLHH